MPRTYWPLWASWLLLSLSVALLISLVSSGIDPKNSGTAGLWVMLSVALPAGLVLSVALSALALMQRVSFRRHRALSRRGPGIAFLCERSPALDRTLSALGARAVSARRPGDRYLSIMVVGNNVEFSSGKVEAMYQALLPAPEIKAIHVSETSYGIWKTATLILSIENGDFELILFQLRSMFLVPVGRSTASPVAEALERLRTQGVS